MAKLNKLDASSIYDTIGKNAPVPEANGPAKKVVVPEEQSVGRTVDLLNPTKKERKTASIYLRCKPEIKVKFDKLCKEKGISQADMFEFWVESLLQ